MELPMLGTAEKTANSQFQVMLTDSTNKSLHPKDYPRKNRFFETVEDRNAFVTMFETTIHKSGGRFVKKKLQHPLFTTFDIIDQEGNKTFDLTIYH